MEEKIINESSTEIKEPCSCEKESKISIGWLVSGILLIALVAIAVLLGVKGSLNIGSYNLSWSKAKVLKASDAQKKVADYINNTVLQGKSTAEIANVTDKNGVYTFKVKVQGQEFDSYMSKDGEVLFPEGMPMAADSAVNADSGANTNASASATIPKAEKATAYLFTMSYCPYGNEAEKAMKPVVDLLKDKAVIEPHYVIYSDYAKNKNLKAEDYCLDSSEKYCSMHGIAEVNQDVRELCVYRDQKDKYWAFIEKTNANCTVKTIEECWKGQAEAAGIDTAKVETCQKNEAETLLAKEVELSTKYKISGSPSLVINEINSTAARSAEGYKTAICSGFNTEPAECSTDLTSAAAGSASTADASCGS